jgi:hypothetical protein
VRPPPIQIVLDVSNATSDSSSNNNINSNSNSSVATSWNNAAAPANNNFE